MKKIITFAVLTIMFTTFCSKLNAAPPMYVNDPDCMVSGVIKNLSFEAGNRGQQYRDCLNPIASQTDCEWILAEGKDKYLITVQVSQSIGEKANSKSACSDLYPVGQDNIFAVSVNFFNQVQLKNEDAISGKVLPGGEFLSLQKNNLDLPVARDTEYFTQKNIFLTLLIAIGLIVIFWITRKVIRNR